MSPTHNSPAPDLGIPVCAECGRQHVVTRTGHRACAKHRTARGPAGELLPCGKPPVDGTDACLSHGAAAPQTRAAAAARVEEQRAEVALRRGLAAAYGEHVPDVDPAEAMLRAVSWKHAEVLALRAKVAELDDRERVWGLTKTTTVEEGSDTQGAKPNLWWTVLRTA